MSNIVNPLNSNFFNKSQLIREVANEIPGMTNKQVRRVIKDRYGLDVGSNLIIAVLGRERTRRLLAPMRETLIRLGQEWFDLCGKDRGYCSEILGRLA
jgi:hypothetical protein